METHKLVYCANKGSLRRAFSFLATNTPDPARPPSADALMHKLRDGRSGGIVQEVVMADKFADDQILELLKRIEDGEPLLQICKDRRMPSRSRVYQMIEADPEFAGQFRAARAQGVHALAEQCLEIADEPASDAVKVADKRVRIDTRLRLAGKWLPKIYGDKIDVNHSGEVQHRHDLSGYSADELDALEALVSKSADTSRDQGGESAAQSGSVH